MFFGKRKDGGDKSTVTGWFFEIKSAFTVALLRLDNGTRDAFHSHAFNSLSYVIAGKLFEQFYDLTERVHTPGALVLTKREDLHRVQSLGTTWVLTFRGPWAKFWFEVVPRNQYFDRLLKLTHGRQVIATMQMHSVPGNITVDDTWRLDNLGLKLTSPDFRDVP